VGRSIGFSNYGYGREAAAFDIGSRDLRLNASPPTSKTSATHRRGVVHRYFFAHRLGVRLSDRVRLALWETTVLAGVDQKFEGRFRNPLSLLLLANQYGQGDEGANVLVGVDLHWRAFRRTTVQAQLAIDDLQYKNRGGPDRYPDRWALTLAAFGPLGGALGWRTTYTQASSLAFRTLDQFENLTERRVGLGRNFADMDQLSVAVTMPVLRQWLVTPDLTLLRQGEGRIGDPFPATPEEAGTIPQCSSCRRRTYRWGWASGRGGPLDLQASAGFHHVVNSATRRADREPNRGGSRPRWACVTRSASIGTAGAHPTVRTVPPRSPWRGAADNGSALAATAASSGAPSADHALSRNARPVRLEHRQGDDLEIEPHRPHPVDVEQAEPRLPGPDHLVVPKIRIVAAAQNLTLIGEDDRREIGDARPDPQQPLLLRCVEHGFPLDVGAGSHQRHLALEHVSRVGALVQLSAGCGRRVIRGSSPAVESTP
jgi:hypothetical protein